MSRTACLLPLAAVLVSACVVTQEPAHPDVSPVFPAATVTPPPVATGVARGPVAARAPRIAFEDVRGDDLARARAVFAPAEASLARCAPNSSGVLRIRLIRRGDQVAYSVASSAELDATGRRCALEALSTVEVNDVGSRGSPSDRPSGFSALIRIEW